MIDVCCSSLLIRVPVVYVDICVYLNLVWLLQWKPNQPWKDQFKKTVTDNEKLCSVIRLKNVANKWDVYLAMPSPLPTAGSTKV